MPCQDANSCFPPPECCSWTGREGPAAGLVAKPMAKRAPSWQREQHHAWWVALLRDFDYVSASVLLSNHLHSKRRIWVINGMNSGFERRLVTRGNPKRSQVT